MNAPIRLGALLLCGGLLASCRSNPASPTASSDLRSEREYAVQSEARAQDLYKTGQASSIEAARAQAAAEANQQWYAAAKAKERRADQEKFEEDFKKSQASVP